MSSIELLEKPVAVRAAAVWLVLLPLRAIRTFYGETDVEDTARLVQEMDVREENA